EDAFKTRLVVYKFKGNALAWWKAYKPAKGGDVWLITVTWAEFKKLFFLQFFPRAEQERLKREYHSIRQTNTETSTEFMQHRRGGSDNHRSSNNNYSGNNNRNSGNGRDQRDMGQQSNLSANYGKSS
nr:zinc finger, CCHC-type, retrotransposon Gag domain protein [Tanacetum cinerariifolium]